MIAVGIDLVELDRISTAMRRTEGRFADTILGPEERARVPAGSAIAIKDLAARFALKEACMKALGTGMSGAVAFRNVVVEDPLGSPRVTLQRGAADRGGHLDVAAIHATVSLSGRAAAAVVVLEGRGKSGAVPT